MAELATSGGGGNFEDGLVIRFVADLSQIRQAIEQLKSEVASQSVSVSVRGNALTAAASGGSPGIAGLLPGIDEPAGMVREDQRTAQRLLAAGEGAARVERLIERDDGSNAIQVMARRRDGAATAVPPTWGGFAGWGGGGGAPIWNPFAGGGGATPMAGGAYGGGAGGPPAAGGGFIPPIGPGGAPINIPNAVPPGAPQPPGGGGGWGGLGWGQLGRIATYGYLASQTMHAVSAAAQYNAEMIVAAGDPRQEAEATLQSAESKYGNGIPGFLIQMLEDPTGAGRGAARRTLADADFADRGIRLRDNSAQYLREFNRAGTVAQARGDLPRELAQIEADRANQADDLRIRRKTEQDYEDQRAARERGAVNAPGWFDEQAKARESELIRLTLQGKSSDDIEGLWRGEALQRISTESSRITDQIAGRYDAANATNEANAVSRQRRARMTDTLRLREASDREDYYRLKSQGRDDEAEDLRSRREMGRERDAQIDNPELYALMGRSNTAEQGYLTGQRQRAAYLRTSAYDDMMNQGWASLAQNPFAASVGGLNAQFRQTVVNAQTPDLLRAIAAGGMAWLGGEQAAYRNQVLGPNLSAEGEAAATGFSARGDRFGEARSNALYGYLGRLNSGGTPQQRQDWQATYQNQLAGIDRLEGMHGEQLRDNVGVLQALAQDNPRLAQVRDALYQTQLAAQNESDPENRRNIYRSGILREQAIQMRGGSAVDVEPGTIGPGFDHGDQSDRELIDAIKQLTDAMNNVKGESFSGGDSSGGDF